MVKDLHLLRIVAQGLSAKRKLAQRRFSSSWSFPSKTIVLFFSNLYPETNASAAGVRSNRLLRNLSVSDGVARMHYITGTHNQPKLDESEDTLRALAEDVGIQFHVLPPNQAFASTRLFESITKDSDEASILAIFDRFYAEEMYSFQIHKYMPQVCLVLDMQDIHSLRWARQRSVQQMDKESPFDATKASHVRYDAAIHVVPDATDDRLLRELASIHRCDASLVCSPVEMDLLRRHYDIAPNKLTLAPLFGNLAACSHTHKYNAFDKRRDFVWIGGFRHDPNVDAVRQLRRLWPFLRERLAPESPQIHIYGAFCSDQLKKELHDPANGFLMHGYCSNLQETLNTARVMLAPLRFGAGIKGKIVDAWKSGLPVVTTSIGSEGMMLWEEEEEEEGERKDGSICTAWPGIVADRLDEFVMAAVSLYTDAAYWYECQRAIPRCLSLQDDDWDRVGRALADVLQNRERRRSKDLSRAILWRETNRSTEYFSRYLESKEELQRNR